MSCIKILSEHVASQIAAGEVVQRPASVVKELIDNSLDAGAGRITVEVEKGGNLRMRVTDDGCGMSAEDLPMALRRHATSKIEEESDLLAIQTYGFRGEALAAISSVSHIEIVSRLHAERHGHRLSAVGGEVKGLEPVGAPPGTSVTVSDLFFNTPARRKFLKSPTTELERINEIIVRTAIGWPNLHLELFHNGRKARLLPPTPACIDRLLQLFGNDIAKELLAVDFGNDRLQITGFTSRATLHRNTAGDLFFFVNRRFVRDRLLLRGLLEAYKASLPQRRYPVSILFIELAPEDVDVNVHPTKEEIRFRDERLVWSGLYSAIRGAFDTGGAKAWVDAPQLPSEAIPDSFRAPDPSVVARSVPLQTNPPEKVDQPPTSPSVPVPDTADSSMVFIQETVTSGSSRPAEAGLAIERIIRKPLVAPSPMGSAAQATAIPDIRWRPVAQIFDSFIIAEAGDEMAIFDQHALHERLQFERLRKEYEEKVLSRQRLVFPLTIDIHPRRLALMANSLSLLNEVGLEIEPFGENTFVVRSVPTDMQLSEVKPFLDDALDDLSAQGMVVPLSDRAERILARVACRSAVKAGDTLTYEQMADLVDRYTDGPTLATCPHGRPPIWRISRREIEKWFGRP